ncbi:hypothetical protein [Paraburkholderia gardini]|uniref:Uncharacterized protein n=1 Tax=Paraburkholderia gardini TaxID=2823469 RepID=A0ABM8U1L7_9BURK|nr:hypothetical protein [Paraburkholderia gardini]CAG4894328.1 hypothetical protein R54767_01719 [Paraburkholderia gardini]CAG4912744.1 hypothetical protein R69919_04026 [Paraburkholderia gardini]
MIIHDGYEISTMTIAFVCFGIVLIAGALAMMRLRHRYPPSLIGALVGALLCFVLLEALPAIT